MEADGAAGFEWTSGFVRGRMREALCCPAASHVVYDVVLLPDAVVRSWCAADAPDTDGRLLFEIEVQAGGRTASRSLQVPAAPARQWRALAVAAPGPGPARIALRVRPAAGAAGSGRALWADPRIESPRPLADLARALRAAFTNGAIRLPGGPRSAEQIYDAHARMARPSRSALRAQRAHARSRSRVVTLVTFVGPTDTWHVETADSVFAQSDGNWEWLLVSADGAERATPLRRLEKRDRRVRVIAVPAATGPAGAWQAALAASTGEFVALLDAGDILSPDALFEMATVADAVPRPDVIYCDEDAIAPGGKHVAPYLKPDWSPELLLSLNYVGRLTLIRRETAAALGGFRESATDAEWDLYLRMSRSTGRFHRVPRCFYHRRARSLPAESPSRYADVAEHLAALGRPAQVSGAAGGCRVVWPPSGRLVSIVVPNRNAPEVLGQIVNGVLHGTDYRATELIIVDNGSTDPGVLALYGRLEESGTGRIVPFPGPFNFSAACNRGAACARGDLLLFLNNDIDVVDRSWLDELVRWAELPEIGVVGAKLLYPDRTIQHAGVVFGIGLVGHIFARAVEGTATPFGSPESYRNYLAVTGACQMMRRAVFDQLGGFDERFRLSFSDVVLCMEAWRAGYRVMYTPYARLIHHESYTRKKEDSAQDMLLLAQYLRASRFTEDRFSHPALDPKSSIPAVRPPLDAAARQVVSNYVERVLADYERSKVPVLTISTEGPS
jgi:GT2 family glycosyltransferase